MSSARLRNSARYFVESYSAFSIPYSLFEFTFKAKLSICNNIMLWKKFAKVFTRFLELNISFFIKFLDFYVIQSVILLMTL